MLSAPFVSSIEQVVGAPFVTRETKALEAYGVDALRRGQPPELVVWPATTVEVAFAERIDAVVAEAGTVHLFIRLEDFSGFEMEVLWEKAKFAFQHLRDIERMAVVGDRAWEEWWVTIAGALSPTETRYFDEDDIDAAWDWLKR